VQNRQLRLVHRVEAARPDARQLIGGGFLAVLTLDVKQLAD
jgi:hypothetical protein